MIRLPNTLAFRLTLRYALAFVTFISAGFLVLYFSLNSILNDRIDEDLEEDVEEFRILLETEGIDKVKNEIKREVKTSDKADVFIRLLNKDGKQLFASDQTHWQGLQLNDEALHNVVAGDGPALVTEKLPQQKYATRIIYGLLESDVVYHAGETVEQKAELMEVLLHVFVVMFVAVIPLASVISWIMANKAVQGIEEVSRTAADIQSGQLDKRVTVQAQGDEIKKLADTFNAMLDRIHVLISEMREMTDNIAHDLRSPLARIRAISEVALSNDRTIEEHKAAAADTIEECDRLLQMINTTLDVAEAEVGIANGTAEKVNVSELVYDACELFEPVAEEKQISLKTDIASSCNIHGKTQNLQRMLANLLDNAVKYTPEKGKINIGLSCNPKGIIIEVKDTGVGIPETDLEKVFERFYRCDQSRSQEGCGLGLSFSRAVARSHGGDITVKSNPGWGSVFTIVLPA